MKQSTADLDRLIKTQAVFERFRRDMQDDRDQMGALAGFKICYETALKMMKAILASEGIEASSPKDIFRQATLIKLINDPEVWFDFQVKRNLTAHAYEEENLTAVVDSFDRFSQELDKLIQAARVVIAKE